MSFAVPNHDFKVVYYDKYTGTSITHILTVLGYKYFTERKDVGSEIESFLRDCPVYIVTASKKEYMWFPTRSANSIYSVNQLSTFRIEDVIPDHMNAVQLVLYSILQNIEKKTNSDDDLVTVYHDEGDFTIFHAKTFKAFQTVATRAWTPDGESGWEYAMSYNSNRIFILHIGDQKTTGKKFVIIGSATNTYAVYDENGAMMAGTSFHLPVKNALDAFCEKLQLTA